MLDMKIIQEVAHDLARSHKNSEQDKTLALHRKHIRAIWSHLEKLEQFIHPRGDHALVLRAGDSQIILKKNGDVTIKGGNILIDSHGKVTVKASSDLALKGRKIQEN